MVNSRHYHRAAVLFITIHPQESFGGMGKSTVVALMKEYGVYPILLGAGRGRGTFWLASAVDSALLEMQRVASTCSFAVDTDAQHPPNCEIRHEEMNIDDLHRLLTYETLHL